MRERGGRSAVSFGTHRESNGDPVSRYSISDRGGMRDVVQEAEIAANYCTTRSRRMNSDDGCLHAGWGQGITVAIYHLINSFFELYFLTDI